jgi:mono/diheme cytochrome c family protein
VGASTLVGAIAFANGPLTAGAQQTPAASQAASPSNVTFTKDIAPVLQRSCQNCHRPGGVGPMPLTTYEEVRPWARSIKVKVSAREMPPWFIEKNVGIQKFKDDPSLSDREIAAVSAWVDSGAPHGNPADMPPLRQFPPVGTWSFGTPDLIVSSPVFTVKPLGADFYPDLGDSPTGLTEDRYIKSFEVREFRPNEQKVERVAGRAAGDLSMFVVHHAGVNAITDAEREGRTGDSEGSRSEGCRTAGGRTADGAECLPQGNFQYVFNVGMNGLTYPEELGVLLKAGSSITYNAHIHSIGREVKAQVQVGFWFHPKDYKPRYPRGIARATGDVRLTELDIPPGEENIRHDSYAVLRAPARMVNFEPHLHSSGKRMCLEAIYPSGERETINCAGYNHAWVKSYVYADDVAPLMPALTILHLTGWYNNSASNPRVVDPRNWKGFGHRSIDDMFQMSSEFLYMTEAEFKAEVEARAAMHARPAATSVQQ